MNGLSLFRPQITLSENCNQQKQEGNKSDVQLVTKVGGFISVPAHSTVKAYILLYSLLFFFFFLSPPLFFFVRSLHILVSIAYHIIPSHRIAFSVLFSTQVYSLYIRLFFCFILSPFPVDSNFVRLPTHPRSYYNVQLDIPSNQSHNFNPYLQPLLLPCPLCTPKDSRSVSSLGPPHLFLPTEYPDYTGKLIQLIPAFSEERQERKIESTSHIYLLSTHLFLLFLLPFHVSFLRFSDTLTSTFSNVSICHCNFCSLTIHTQKKREKKEIHLSSSSSSPPPYHTTTLPNQSMFQVDNFISFHDLTPEAHFLWASSSITTCLGYEPEEIVDTPAYTVIHPDDISYVKVSHQENMMNEMVGTQIALRFKAKDGSWVPCMALFSLCYDYIVTCSTVIAQTDGTSKSVPF